MNFKTPSRLLWAALAVAIATQATAQVQIQNLPAAAAAVGTDPMPSVQGGVTVKQTVSGIDTYVKANGAVATASVGGTGQSTPTDDTTLVGNGTVWNKAALPSCSGATNTLTYNTSTNAFGCNTISGSVTQSTGTGTLNYTTGCTVAQTQNYAFVTTGQVVTLTFTSQFACTSNATTMASDALPAGLRPARDQVFGPVQAQNNSGVVLACFRLGTDGVLTWFQVTGTPLQCATSGAWTASGTKGPLTLISSSPFIAMQSAFTYTLN